MPLGELLLPSIDGRDPLQAVGGHCPPRLVLTSTPVYVTKFIFHIQFYLLSIVSPKWAFFASWFLWCFCIGLARYSRQSTERAATRVQISKSSFQLRFTKLSREQQERGGRSSERFLIRTQYLSCWLARLTASRQDVMFFVWCFCVWVL